MKNFDDYTLTIEMNLRVTNLLGRDTRTNIFGIEKLAKDIPEEILADQIAVSDRIISLISTGFRSYIENVVTRYYESLVSGGSRHSFCLMSAYGQNPLEDLSLGRFDGSDFLNGRGIDLFGDDKEAKEVLRRIRTEEGVGLLRINNEDYTITNSGVAFPFNNSRKEYVDTKKNGMMISSVLDFSRKYNSRSDNPVWFFRLNEKFSLIQDGKIYDVDYV